MDSLVQQAQLKTPSIGGANIHKLNGLLHSFFSIHDILLQHPEKTEYLSKFNFLQKIVKEYIQSGNMNELSKRYNL